MLIVSALIDTPEGTKIKSVNTLMIKAFHHHTVLLEGVNAHTHDLGYPVGTIYCGVSFNLLIIKDFMLRWEGGCARYFL